MNHIVFIRTVWDYYKKNKRSMPWREDVSPYSVFISEVMLQQTQVGRVQVYFQTLRRYRKQIVINCYLSGRGWGITGARYI
jgi:adenine-specific DNA glycosylase